MKEDKILKKGFNTLAIHGEGEERKPANALNSPVFMTSTFTFDNLDHAERTFSFDCDDYVYTRGNNPNLRELERKMALLEGGVDSVVFATGMAAISSVLFSLLKPGDKIIAHQVLYGSSYNVIKKLLPAYGIKSEFVDLTAVDKLEEYLGDESDEVRVIYFETPANPNLDLIDIKAIAELAGDKDIKIVVDNTFATPYLQRPLELGADVVVHSATKYLNGHGDVLGGVAVAKEEDYIQSLKFEYMTEFGGVLSPFNAWLILRGLKTLGIRMEKHQENARKVAEYLAEHDKVQKVFYPGLTG
ncbi:MAG: PLP-dependent transferase, partial [Halanaerobiaceae bacterium]|nr:PLP-dependent transferase [Halanaerobiaceae bacterium]